MVIRRWPFLTVAVAGLVLVTLGTAQRQLPKGKDLRDVVKTKKGKEHRGRVLRLFDDKEIVLLQGSRPVAGGTAGGKRIRIPRDHVGKNRTNPLYPDTVRSPVAQR